MLRDALQAVLDADDIGLGTDMDAKFAAAFQKAARLCQAELAALATPSPQAQQGQCSAFSPTSAREQSAATAAILELALSTLEKDWPPIPRTKNHDDVIAWAFGVDQLVRRQLAMLRAQAAAPAATQEQPAGSGASELGAISITVTGVQQVAVVMEALRASGLRTMEGIKIMHDRIGSPRKVGEDAPDLIRRCMARNSETGQCELREGHAGKHLGGYLMWGSSSVPVGEQKQEEGV